MAYRTLTTEENDTPEGQDQILSPFIQFDTEEDANNSEKRMISAIEEKVSPRFLFSCRISLEPSERSR